MLHQQLFLRLHMPGFSLKISLERGRWQRPVQEYKMWPNFFEELVSKLRQSTSKFVVKSKTSCLKFEFVDFLDNLAFLKLFMRQLSSAAFSQNGRLTELSISKLPKQAKCSFKKFLEITHSF